MDVMGKKGDSTSKRQLTLRKLQALAESTAHPPEAAAARDKIEQLQIHTEQVQVAPVNVGRDDQGTITIGYWFLDGNAVVVCDSRGEPKRHRDIPTRIVPLADQ